MARRTVVELIDDIDGKSAHETVTFSLDGTAYEIDLSVQNAGRLRSGLAPYVERARKGGSGAPRGGERVVAAHPATARPGHSREESARIRDWARQNGIVVNERGRIPAKVIEAYQADDADIAKTGDVLGPAAKPAAKPSGKPSGKPAARTAEPAEAESEPGEPKAPVRPIPQATFQAVSNP
jgi:hypothetical protein